MPVETKYIERGTKGVIPIGTTATGVLTSLGKTVKVSDSSVTEANVGYWVYAEVSQQLRIITEVTELTNKFQTDAAFSPVLAEETFQLIGANAIPKSMAVVNIGAADGELGGETISPNKGVEWEDELCVQPMSYDATGTTFQIAYKL